MKKDSTIKVNIKLPGEPTEDELVSIRRQLRGKLREICSEKATFIARKGDRAVKVEFFKYWLKVDEETIYVRIPNTCFFKLFGKYLLVFIPARFVRERDYVIHKDT